MHLKFTSLSFRLLVLWGLAVSGCRTRSPAPAPVLDTRHRMQIEPTTWPQITEPEVAWNPSRDRFVTVLKQENERGIIQDLLLVADMTSGEAWRVASLDYPHRPIREVAWTGDTQLRFTIWTTKHFGIEYRLSVTPVPPRILTAQRVDDAYIRKLQELDHQDRLSQQKRLEKQRKQLEK